MRRCFSVAHVRSSFTAKSSQTRILRQTSRPCGQLAPRQRTWQPGSWRISSTSGHSKDSRAFRDEFEDAKQRQDQGLDEISKGLSVLKNLGGEMDDEIKRQTPILDVIDEKLDSTTAEMRTANGKLKKVITSMRSTRNFCVDVILIFIILGIAMFFMSSFG